MKQLFIILLIISLFLTSCGKTTNSKITDTQNSSEKSVITNGAIDSSTAVNLEENESHTANQTQTILDSVSILTESTSSDINSSENSTAESSSSEISSSQSSKTITTPKKDENAQQTDIIIRESLSKDQIECVAYDVVALLSLFYDGTYSMNRDEAEQFILMLIAQTSEKNIKDNYIPNLYSYISPEKTKIIDSKINGEYVKILMKEIFDYKIEPRKEYDYPIGDPAPFGLDLKSLKNENGKNYAKFYLCDVDGTPDHEIDITFSLTLEGNTRIGPITVRSLNDEEIKEAVATMAPYED